MVGLSERLLVDETKRSLATWRGTSASMTTATMFSGTTTVGGRDSEVNKLKIMLLHFKEQWFLKYVVVPSPFVICCLNDSPLSRLHF